MRHIRCLDLSNDCSRGSLSVEASIPYIFDYSTSTLLENDRVGSNVNKHNGDGFRQWAKEAKVG